MRITNALAIRDERKQANACPRQTANPRKDKPDQFSRSLKIKELVLALGIEHPLFLQSMYIFKQPNIGGEVTCHQDATFLYTEPLRMAGLWFALEDAGVENGCLWAIPGGHKLGLKSRFMRFMSRLLIGGIEPMHTHGRSAAAQARKRRQPRSGHR